ncbi:MAG: CDP-alcohol phosphatidyltransferase family protein [Deinococcales bacterium]
MNLPEAAKPRPRREWIMVLVQPLASRGVAWGARAGIAPTTVVTAHGLIGLAAAALLATQAGAAWLGAALLLQVKTVLDNIDGGLARATGRVTEAGRYLDTVVDLVVNLALFAALARHGSAAWAAGAFLALTLILSLDFNLERRYRTLRGEDGTRAAELPPDAPRWVLTAPRAVYRALLEPQDRLLTWCDRRLFEQVTGTPDADAPARLRLAWSDLFSSASIVNLGLSTQLALLGALCLLGRPYLFVPAVYLQLVYVVAVQAIRVVRLRRTLREGSGSAA